MHGLSCHQVAQKNTLINEKEELIQPECDDATRLFKTIPIIQTNRRQMVSKGSLNCSMREKYNELLYVREPTGNEMVKEARGTRKKKVKLTSSQLQKRLSHFNRRVFRTVTLNSKLPLSKIVKFAFIQTSYNYHFYSYFYDFWKLSLLRLVEKH